MEDNLKRKETKKKTKKKRKEWSRATQLCSIALLGFPNRRWGWDRCVGAPTQ